MPFFYDGLIPSIDIDIEGHTRKVLLMHHLHTRKNEIIWAGGHSDYTFTGVYDRKKVRGSIYVSAGGYQNAFVKELVIGR